MPKTPVQEVVPELDEYSVVVCEKGRQKQFGSTIRKLAAGGNAEEAADGSDGVDMQAIKRPMKRPAAAPRDGNTAAGGDEAGNPGYDAGESERDQKRKLCPDDVGERGAGSDADDAGPAEKLQRLEESEEPAQNSEEPEEPTEKSDEPAEMRCPRTRWKP